MKNKNIIRLLSITLVICIMFSPIITSAATLRRGTRNNEVVQVQKTLQRLGYFTYPRATGYYGPITEKAVKKFQKDHGLLVDGLFGKNTRGSLNNYIEENSISSMSIKKVTDTSKMGSFDWFSKVRYIWKRNTNALITDVETGRTFELRRTFGTRHADVEPLTKKDAKIIKDIWNGWSWERRAVVVEVGGYVLAGSLAAMPHAGVDSKPAVRVVNGRSGGYGRGQNLDAVKNNGVSGVMDLHFKNSRTHSTNEVRKSHQDMVEKAAKYIAKTY